MIRRLHPLALVAMLAPATGCTILDLWDPPVVVVDDVPCDEDTDCAGVRYEVSDEIASEPCIVAIRSCNTEAGRCNVALEARDSDDDNFRDMACADKVTEFEPRRVDCVDADDTAFPGADFDRDGFVVRGCSIDGQPEDCDDTRATAFPGQTIEACDGVVSTCTDTTPPPRRREEDFDGDRFAPVGLAESVCADVRSGNDWLSFERTDCDDADERVYPGALDVCDGRNNDCKSVLGVGVDPLEDFDRDGFAPPTTTACNPAIPGGFPITDCDDEDAKTYPGAPESCDLIVNDCDARTGTNFDRLSEDPDGDSFFAGDADCIDPVVNIECSGAGFDRYAQYCAPRREVTLGSGAAYGVYRLLGGDLNADGLHEVVLARPNGSCTPTQTDEVAVRYSFSAASPLGSTTASASACVDATVRSIDLADLTGDGTPEIVVVDGTSVRAISVASADPSIALTVRAPMTGVTVVVPASSDAKAAIAFGELAPAAGVEMVAFEGTNLVYRTVSTNMVTVSAATVIAAYPTAGAALVVADVTNDGVSDVVVGNGNTITIHPRSGTSGFGAAQTIDLTTALGGIGAVVDLLAADVEGGGDGDLDLVVQGATGLGILASRPAGFSGVSVGIAPNGSPLGVGAIVPSSIAARDLDGDGKVEILYAEYAPDTVAYVDEVGSNIFVQHVVVSDFDGAALVTGADVDLDRDVDVVAYAGNQQQLSWFEATFVSNLEFDERSIDRAFDGVTDVEIGDIDSDGRSDVIAMSGSVGGEIHAWRSRLANASSFDELVVHVSTGSAMTGIAVGDANGDDALDLAVVSTGSDAVGFIRGNGDRTFEALEALGTFDAPSDVRLVDLDLDGNDEIVVSSANGTEGRIAVYVRPLGENSFARTILATGTANCTSISVGRIDRDEFPDLGLACGAAGIFVFRNPGTIGGSWTESTIDATVGANYGTVALGDLDRDGDDDVVAYRHDTRSVAIRIMEDGAPSGPLRTVPFDLLSPGGASLALGDLDRDGDVDIVAAGRSNQGAIRVLQAVDGARGRYIVQTVFGGGGSSKPAGLALGDLDGDGRADVVATLSLESDLLWWGTSGATWWDH